MRRRPARPRCAACLSRPMPKAWRRGSNRCGRAGGYARICPSCDVSGLRGAAYGLTALLGLVVLGLLGAELFTLAEPLLKNYNEGWNAYHIAAAMQDPAALYPARASLFTNNYPPLSFFIVGEVARFTGDAIIAGRIVAFLSTLGTGLCLALAARAMGCS